MTLRNSLLTGIAALALGMMAPVANAQTSDVNGQTAPAGSEPTGGSQMNSAPSGDMGAPAAKHKKHHKKHQMKASTNTALKSSEEAKTEQLNRQQMGQAGAGMATGAGNENAATYSAPNAMGRQPVPGAQPGMGPQPGMQGNTTGTYQSPAGTSGSSNTTSDSPNSSGGSTSNNNGEPQSNPPPQ